LRQGEAIPDNKIFLENNHRVKAFKNGVEKISKELQNRE
jgi:hypothetical protein